MTTEQNVSGKRVGAVSLPEIHSTAMQIQYRSTDQGSRRGMRSCVLKLAIAISALFAEAAVGANGGAFCKQLAAFSKDLTGSPREVVLFSEW
jgi:hypothetical protein